MADRLRPVMAQPQLAVQADPLLLREGALLLLELERHVEQAFLHALGGHRLGQEGEVVAEHEDRGRVVHLFVLPRAGSTTQWRAMIFSPSVMGRGGVAGGESTTFPWSRATLKLNSPPYSMIPRVISPSPAVNALRGIASPRRTLSMIEKSVVVRTPRF